MARYIDADALIEEINKFLKSPYAEHREPLTGMRVRKEAIQLVQHLCVEAAPTAYNVEAVVAELEEQRKTTCSNAVDWAYRKAINIVRNAGKGEV